MSIINESGLYNLILKSRKPEAKAFKKWVTRDVLPAIRKDGAYVMGEEKVKTGVLELSSFVSNFPFPVTGATVSVTSQDGVSRGS